MKGGRRLWLSAKHQKPDSLLQLPLALGISHRELSKPMERVADQVHSFARSGLARCRIRKILAVRVQFRQRFDLFPALTSVYLLDGDLIEIPVKHGSTLLC